MTDTVQLVPDILWGDAVVAINHNTNEFDAALLTKLTDADVKLQSGVAATTGDVTINKPTGRALFITGGTSIVVTNSLVTADSNVFCSVLAADTATIKNVIPAAGSFNILLTAGASAELAVAFMVINPST
jgi:hypothetical protein